MRLGGLAIAAGGLAGVIGNRQVEVGDRVAEGGVANGAADDPDTVVLAKPARGDLDAGAAPSRSTGSIRPPRAAPGPKSRR